MQWIRCAEESCGMNLSDFESEIFFIFIILEKFYLSDLGIGIGDWPRKWLNLITITNQGQVLETKMFLTPKSFPAGDGGREFQSISLNSKAQWNTVKNLFLKMAGRVINGSELQKKGRAPRAPTNSRLAAIHLSSLPNSGFFDFKFFEIFRFWVISRSISKTTRNQR